MIIINYRDDFPSHILAAGDVAAVCLLVVCFFPFMFLQVLLTIPCMGAVCFLFSPQMQQLVTQFFTIGVYLFKLSPLLSLQTPFSFNLSNKKTNKKTMVLQTMMRTLILWALALLIFVPLSIAK